ncbi:unnamed protein product [Rotaria magnacalcarata]|uniref:long-chain-fatty-acid--CoA ligase n=6 Tax=Rotaria magnacalcarata TaxID=392030 RepID=A0A814HZA3_9BILA|nr:unnamed protein product [Rotaria magnacalcarata]CAF3870294.1 unnamed protein product [Rotaria magnacalcarata]CAF4107121.1 unnamed protein product [Rotaria magnacalcarata]
MASFVITAIITILVVVITFLLNSYAKLFKIIFKRPVKQKGAVEVDTTEHIYAHPDCVDKLKDYNSIGVQTLYDVLLRGLDAGRDRPLFSFRKSSEEPFSSYTYKEVFQIIKETGSGIASLGLTTSNDTYIGIYGSASVSYALALYSCWPFSMVPIGIYDSLGQDGVRYIIKHAEVKLIFADDITRVKNLIEWKDDTLALQIIITFVEPTPDLLKAAADKNLQLITYGSLREMGRNNLVDFAPPKPNDIALIMYTSGSTGEPKGCIITHENFITAMFGCATAIDLDSLALNEVPRAMNFLPMAHMFGCGTLLAITYLGGEVGFWQGKVDKLLDDFRDFRPTLLSIVPRLLNRLYDKVRSEILKKGVPGRILFRLAIHGKLALIRRGDFSQDTIWDKLLFEKVRQQFGGQVRRVVSSSAPLSAEVCQFARAAFSCFLIEAYGQTECVIGCWQTLNDMKSGETGIPTVFNHVKLVDVPEKDYYAKDGVGEICIRSRAVFSGYLKDADKTREVIDEKGWLHTGDIGRWTPWNTLKIVDRKKNMYKLSQGEYVAPEKIEDAYSRSQFVSQVFVYGDSYKNFPVAIVVLNDDFIKRWITKDDKNAQYNTEAKLKEHVLNDMLREGKKRGLMSFEQVKAIELIKEPFTIENGLLTPTFKSRRFAVEKKYKDFFIKLYQQIDA